MSTNPPKTRFTIDLDSALHKDMKRWALEHDTSLADVTRALYARVLEHPPTAAAIVRDLAAREGKG